MVVKQTLESNLMSGNKNSMKFRIEARNGAWFITDPDNGTLSERVQIDQAVVDATHVSTDKRVVEGYILSVYGLNFEAASQLSRPVLNQLGVAAQLRSIPPVPHRGSGLTRVRLYEGGTLTTFTRKEAQLV